MADNSPQLGGERTEQLISGSEPLLKADPDYHGMGKRQKAVLQYLAKQDDGECAYLDIWAWVMCYSYPDYRDLSDSRQNKLHPFIGKTTWSLLQSLVGRHLVLLVRQPGERMVDAVRLLVTPEDIREQIGAEDLIKVCPVCNMPLGNYVSSVYDGCCSKKCEIRQNGQRSRRVGRNRFVW